MSKDEPLFFPPKQKVSTMPIFASEPATTVRQRSPWLLPKLAYGAIFLTVALAAYGWKFFSSRPLKVDVPSRLPLRFAYTTPTFAFQHAWQEILAQAKSEVRENLHVEAQRSGQETVVAISLSSLPAETIVPMVNIVASAYSQACRAQWKLQLEQAYSAAEEKVRQTERQAFEAQTRFELLRDRRLQALANLRPVAPPQPRRSRIRVGRKSVAAWRNSRSGGGTCCSSARRCILPCRKSKCGLPTCGARWPRFRPRSRRCRRRTRRRRPVSCRPTCRRRGSPGSPAGGRAVEARLAAGPSSSSMRQLTARGEELRIDLLAAEALPLPPAAAGQHRDPRQGPGDRGDLDRRPRNDLAGGLAGAGAVGSIAELQALLPVPIVGVIPATHPGRRRAASPLRRRLARWGWMAAGLAVLLAVAWLFFRG